MTEYSFDSKFEKRCAFCDVVYESQSLSAKCINGHRTDYYTQLMQRFKKRMKAEYEDPKLPDDFKWENINENK